MDTNNIDFASIWQQQKVSEPNMDDLLYRLKQYKKSSLRKLFISNILLIATSVFIIFIWNYYQPQFVTTKIGIVLAVLAMLIFVVSNNNLVGIYTSIDNTKSNTEYLQKLSAIKTKQKFMQTSILSLYFIMLSLGISLYMYEYTIRMTIAWGLFTYAITFAWIGFNWFYLRPKTIKKQESKLNELIEKFESLNEQLKEE